MLSGGVEMLRFFKPKPWDIGGVAAPWSGKPAILDFIAQHADAERASTMDLPDEKRDDRLRFVAGAWDGVFGHHVGGSQADQAASAVLLSLKALTEKSTDDRAAAFYAALTSHPAIEYVDALLPRLASHPALKNDRVTAVARWIATRAPDRDPVKIAIAILGVASLGEDLDVLVTLGKHEEFTLFAATAISHCRQEPDPSLWELAQQVSGWGRIHIIERLAATQDQRIQHWLLRDGCRNDIMDEYTALVCARTGNLIAALRQPDADAALVKGAGAIVSALIRGGPAEGIEAYADGAEAAERYLRHLDRHEADLEDIDFVTTIERFIADGAQAGSYESDWQSRANGMMALVRTIKERPDWSTKVHEGLASEDRVQFWKAAHAASIFGIDPWDAQFQRLLDGQEEWYSVMQTDDPQRIDRVVELALARLPLDEMASGPAEELGIGPSFSNHSALDFVVQDLRRFPGKGWPLVRAALRSPVTRNRNMAVKALAAWERSAWPPEAELLVRQAARAEPNAKTRVNMDQVVAGKPLTDE